MSRTLLDVSKDLLRTLLWAKDTHALPVNGQLLTEATEAIALEEAMVPELVYELLQCVGDWTLTLADVSLWSPEQLVEAEEWAQQLYAYMAEVPAMPEFLRPYTKPTDAPPRCRGPFRVK